ncbi:MAG: hypothetical protein HY927_13450 [Elusimicrobia bacterium]|nr:hypothetical protein [Elusimicrobiota bacterium]
MGPGAGHLAAFLAALVSSLALVPLVRAIARRRGWVSTAKCEKCEERWSRRPVALLGGIGVFLAFVLALAVVVPFKPNNFWSLVGVGAFFCGLGLLDDIVNLRPTTKLIGQITGAALAVFLGHQIEIRDWWVVNPVISMFWIVAVTNAFNLIDNMDGLAAGIGAITLAFLAASFALAGQAVPAQMSLALMGALLGFLVFNFHPASVFMGDSGSMFIGFTLSSLSLRSGSTSSALAALAVPALIFLVPVMDMLLVSGTRILRGRSIAQGGTDHSSHRLVALGLSERKAVATLYVLAAATGAAALWLNSLPDNLRFILFFLIVVAMSVFGVYLAQLTIAPQEADPAAAKGGWATTVFFELTFKRRLLEILLDVAVMVLCFGLANALRFDFEIPPGFVTTMVRSLPLVIMASLSSFFAAGVYKGSWRYAGVSELGGYLAASFVSAVTSVFLAVLVFRFENFSRSVFLIYGTLLFVCVALSRFSFRLIGSAVLSMRPVPAEALTTLIYGAGEGGALVIEELAKPRFNRAFTAVGFIDDDPKKADMTIRGVKVLGTSDAIETLYRKPGFLQVVIASDKISPERQDRVRRFCRAHNVPVKRVVLVVEDV